MSDEQARAQKLKKKVALFVSRGYSDDKAERLAAAEVPLYLFIASPHGYPHTQTTRVCVRVGG